MNCEEAKTLVAAHADGELGLPHANDLEAHLERCADCRSQLAALTELRAGVRAHAAYHAAPEGLALRVRDALRGEGLALPAAIASDGVPAVRPRRAWSWAWPQVGAAPRTAAEQRA